MEQGILLNWMMVGINLNVTQVVADQQRMMQFQQMLAMAPTLPSMTANDMASICGLTASDLAGLREYMQGIMAMNCQKLAQLGITSSQLSSLAQIASLTGVTQVCICQNKYF